MFAGSRCLRIIKNETLFQRESDVGKVWLLAQIEQSNSVADKLNIFVRQVTLRARPPLRPCAFRLSGAAW